MGEFRLFLRSVYRGWKAVVTGVLITAISFAAALSWFDNRMVVLATVVLAGLGAAAATFPAWRNEHRARLKAEALAKKALTGPGVDMANRLADVSGHLATMIAEMRSKLGSASVDDIKVRLDTLDASLSSLRPRRLGSGQRSALSDLLRGASGTALIYTETTTADAHAYGEDITNAFHDAGWTAECHQASGPRFRHGIGLSLMVSRKSSMTVAEKAAASALTAAQCAFEIHEDEEAVREMGTDVQIRVTRKEPQ